jgi:predicted kinase
MISGLPASGKSFFAQALRDKISARYLSSDVIREQLKLRGQYDERIKKRVYDEMLRRAQEYINEGQDVILDASFYKEGFRNPFIQLAKDRQIELSIIVIKAHEDVIAERMKEKRKYSEADFEVYLKLKEEYEPIKEDHLTLWSDSVTIKEMLNKAINYFQTTKKYDFK